jgi:hypothetical protein
MTVNGLDNVSYEQLSQEIRQGGRFVVFQYCISIVILTFKRPSGIYYIRPGENAKLKGLPFSLISVILGWWGFPWGPIYTIASVASNFGGGEDVTDHVLNTINGRPVPSVFP